MMVRNGFVSLAMLAFAAAPAFAASEDGEACMTRLPLSEALVEEAGAFDYTALYAGDAAVIVGALSPTRENIEIADEAFGAVLFVRAADGAWSAYLPRHGESLVGAYRDGASGALALFTQWQSGDPGQSWTLIRLPAPGAEAACQTVAFPAALNRPHWAGEFLNLEDFNIDARGRGEIVGAAHVERGGREQHWRFAYETRDGGATWRAPRKLRNERPARTGLFERLEETPVSAGLAGELRSYAAAQAPPQ